MKFGHFCLPTYFADVDGSVGDFMRRFVELMVDSEELGFDFVMANEHHFDSYGGLVPSPPMMLCALAQRTKRVRLGTSIVVLPLHNPIEIAEQMAMIDLMSNGRVELGVGSGFVAYDYDRFGVALETGRERMREGLDVILKAWKGGPFTHEGKYYRHHNLEVWPRPQQRPHPPIWISCSQTPESFEWAGRNGYSVLTVAYRGVDILVKNNQLYRDAWKAAGHPPGQGRIAVHYQVVLSEDGKEARAIIAKALERYLGATTHTLDRSREDRERSSQADYRDVNRQILDIDQMLAQCRIVAGTPDDAVRILEKAHDMMGFTQVDCTFYFGGIPYAEAQRSQRLFATQVMPRLRGRVAKIAA